MKIFYLFVGIVTSMYATMLALIMYACWIHRPWFAAGVSFLILILTLGVIITANCLYKENLEYKQEAEMLETNK